MPLLALLTLLLLLTVAAAPALGSSTARNDSWFDDYHSYEEIVTWFKLLAVDNNERLVFYPRIVRAYEGRDVICVRLSTPGGVTPPLRRKIFIQSAQSGRDWVAVTTAMYLVQTLLSSTDPVIRQLMLTLEFVFVPIANPDGYAYTWDTDRNWTKNRNRIMNGRNCTSYGVALDRNWDDHWGERNSSADPDSPQFQGERPFSEAETGAMAYFIAYDLRNVIGTIDLRSAGQEIVYPYGWTSEPNEETATYERLSTDMARLISQAGHGTVYTTRPSSTTGLSSGTFLDWAYGEDLQQVITRKPLSLQINLRPGPGVENGHVLPPKQIEETAAELLPAFLHFCQAALSRAQDWEK